MKKIFNEIGRGLKQIIANNNKSNTAPKLQNKNDEINTKTTKKILRNKWGFPMIKKD